MSPDIDRLRLIRTEGVGAITYARLLARYPDPAEAIAALPELARRGGRASPPIVPAPLVAEAELERVARLGGRHLFRDGPDYPPALAELDDAPPVLMVLGNPANLATPAVALVGGRNASANGLRMAEVLAAELATSLVVVSGMARGVDAAAHHGALSVGVTVACVAGGLDVPYPPEHAGLQARIADRGAVVTEAPPGTEPQARHFPRRNRLIAGLSLGVVVVEAALRSGSLITARYAEEMARALFAVPGSPLDPRARGGNDLIRQGATLVETAEDVFRALPHELPSPAPRLALAEADATFEPPPDAASRVTGLLGADPVAVDDLVRRCHLPAPAVMAVLLELELGGRVQLLPGNRVALLAG